MKKWRIITWVEDENEKYVIDAICSHFTSYKEAKNKFNNSYFTNGITEIELIEYQVYNGAVYNEQTLEVKREGNDPFTSLTAQEALEFVLTI